jgi:hypothetical protein
MADFDKAARYQAKQDPPGFLCWLWRSRNPPLVFHSWIDARRLALPTEGDLTCDTVAGLRLPDTTELAGALLLEFETQSRPGTLGRFLDYLVRALRESGTAGLSLGRLGVAVVNLTGPPQPNEVDLRLPDLPCTLHFRILQRTLREEDAAATVAAIATGQTTPWLLPWIPLMRGGNEPGIMEAWKAAASAEPDERRRRILAALTLIFAELVDQAPGWRQSLEGWNVKQSALLEEARDEGRLESCRDVLLGLLEDRFGPVPEEVVQRIKATTDLAKLKAAARRAPSLPSLNDLPL